MLFDFEDSIKDIIASAKSRGVAYLCEAIESLIQ